MSNRHAPKRRRALSDGRSEADRRFVRLPHWVLETPAWRSLSPTARALYVELARRFNGRNNGAIGLGRDQAMRAINVGSPHTIKRAFGELEERGFIRATSRGGFTYKAGARQGRATEWALTEHPIGDAAATKEFASWRPKLESKSKTRVQSAHRHGAERVPARAQSMHPEGTERAPVRATPAAPTGAEDVHHIVYQAGGNPAVMQPDAGRSPPPLPAYLVDLAALRSGGLSDTKVAERLDVHPATLRLWRCGRRNPSDGHRAALARLREDLNEILR